MAEFISSCTCSMHFRCDVALYIRMQLLGCRIAREKIAQMSPHSTGLNWLNDDMQAACQINSNRHQGLTHTSQSSLGAADADVRPSKLGRPPNLYHKRNGWPAVHQIVNPHDYITQYFFLPLLTTNPHGRVNHYFGSFVLQL